MEFRERVFGSIIGLVVGDALGAPVEFKERGTYSEISQFQSGGEFNLMAGQWTDDTSLALCLIESFNSQKKFHLKDQLNNFYKWWQFGFLSSTGFCFDIGNTTNAALKRYLLDGLVCGGRLTDPATNGALMRLAPVPLFFHHSLNDSIKYSVIQTQTTHAPIECIEASVVLAYVINFALNGKNKKEILKFTHLEYKFESKIKDLLDGAYSLKLESEISAKGFAYNTLEAALYAFNRFDSFKDGLVFVVNLGDDTDTVGAVYGQIAGAYYGINEIPESYRNNIYDKELINNMVEKFWEIIK